MVIFVRPKTPAFINNSAHKVGAPLLLATPYFSQMFAPIKNVFYSKQSLVTKIAELESELLEKELRSKTSLVIEQNYETLSALMGRSLNETIIASAVLLRPPQTPYDTLIIDAGSSMGIEKGNLVQSPEGVVLGTVANVFERTSVVELFSSYGKETVVHIGKEQIEMIAKGRGGGNFEAEAPRTVVISEGDVVVLPGLSPKAFAVVEEIIMRPSDAFQRILFKNPSNLFELRVVGVIDGVTRELPDEQVLETTLDTNATSSAENATTTREQL